MNGLYFLRLVLPPSGWYVGWAKKGETRRQMSFRTIEALHAWCVNLDNQGFDVYYACASFREEKIWDAAEQRYRRRSHDNVLLIADLWADIDTRESKPNAPYADREEAAQAVVAFCGVEKLPSPLWVGSGGGLHVHWPFTVTMGLDDWLAYAVGLKRAAQGFGLRIDPARTADASSILRVPGTHHHRTGRLVQANSSTERFAPARFEHLKRYINEQDRNRRVVVAAPARNDSPVAAAIISNIRDEPSDLNLIRRGCAQIGRIAEHPGKFGEPVNRLVAGIAKCCGNGPEVYLSWLDPEWRSTGRDYFERYNADPPRCDTFESLNPGGCDGCPVKGKITSPIWLGRQAERKIERLGADQQIRNTGSAAPVAELNGFPVLSERWGLDPGSRLCELSEDKNGEQIFFKVSEHPIYLSGVHSSEVLEKTSYTFKHKLPNEDWAEINIPADSMGNGRGVPELMNSGVVIHNPKLFTEYMNEQIGEFNRVPGQRRSIKYEQCGWKGHDYLFGTVLYKSDGSIFKAVTSDDLASRAKLGLGLMAGGDARAWVSITNQLFSLDHYCAWLNIGCSFGSLFMPWHSRSEGGGIISNITPESGKGKTRIAQASAGIWGHWNALSIKDYDTPASQGLILASLCNIPAFVDELAHFARHAQFGVLHLREFLDKYAAGHDKHRALQHGMGIRHQLGSWGNILITTSNQAIIDMIDVAGGSIPGGNATSMRIAEFDATPPRTFDTTLGDQLEPHIWLNHGHAGDAFLKHIIRPDIQTEAHKHKDAWLKMLWEQSRFGSEQRFRIRMLACAAVGLMLARDRGLVPRDLDIPAVIQWGQEQVSKGIPVLSTKLSFDMATDAVSRFLSAHIVNTLRVQHPFKAHTTQIPLGQRPQKLVIRHETESRKIYAVQKEFRNFVVTAGFPYEAVIKALAATGVITNDRRMMTLGAGTEYASVQIACVEFNASHPVFSSVLQEVPDARVSDARVSEVRSSDEMASGGT